jgi:glycosyltransferase involved in cell wall biosynthesis
MLPRNFKRKKMSERNIHLTDEPQKICYYLSNIVHNPAVIKERWARFSGAGCLRTLFLAHAMRQRVKIVSMGPGERQGIFQEKHEVVDDKVSIIYLMEWDLILFRKKLRHLFYAIFLFWYLLRNVRKQDLVLIYNTDLSIFMMAPVLLAQRLLGFCYLLEVEEFYSHRRHSNGLNLPEKISVQNAAGYVLVSEGQLPMVDQDKPRILNGGYRSRTDGPVSVRNKAPKIPRIIYTGRLDQEGGIAVFLEALKYIERKCRVTITGSGPLEELVKKYRNGNNYITFEYHGFLSRDEYRELLLESQIGVNPIRSQLTFGKVSFPSKILQYLEYGNVVISSNIVALNNLKPLDKYIFTYNGDSPGELAQTINRVLEMKFDKPQVSLETHNFLSVEEQRLNEFFDQFV